MRRELQWAASGAEPKAITDLCKQLDYTFVDIPDLVSDGEELSDVNMDGVPECPAVPLPLAPQQPPRRRTQLACSAAWPSSHELRQQQQQQQQALMQQAPQQMPQQAPQHAPQQAPLQAGEGHGVQPAPWWTAPAPQAQAVAPALTWSAPAGAAWDAAHEQMSAAALQARLQRPHVYGPGT